MAAKAVVAMGRVTEEGEQALAATCKRNTNVSAPTDRLQLYLIVLVTAGRRRMDL
jgi:hypothetical protein